MDCRQCKHYLKMGHVDACKLKQTVILDVFKICFCYESKRDNPLLDLIEQVQREMRK